MKFQTKLLLLFVSLFVFTAVLMLFFSIELQHQVVDAAERDVQNITHYVHLSSQKLSNEQAPNQEFLKKFIHDAKSNDAVKEISIIGSTSEVIASSNPHKLGRHHQIKDEVMIMREQFGDYDSSGPHNSYNVTVPIIRDKKLIGLVQTSFVVNDLGVFVKRVFFKQAFIAIFALFTLFLLVYIAIRKINKPITLLCRAAEQVASGDNSIQVDSKGSDELRGLINAFNDMARRLGEHRILEENIRDMERKAILSETAAVMAHEIRNPLNLINLSVDHLIDEYQPSEDERKKQYTELMTNVKRETLRLNRMVTNFLTYGKPERLHSTQFTLKELLAEVELLLKHQLIEVSTILTVSIDETVRLDADKEQIRLVILNLILNAIQVTGSGGIIDVNSSVEESTVRIDISDNGPGISTGDMDKIFEPYFSTRPGGTGLGLALVRRIIQAHEGTVTARNLEKGGACFEIVLPRKDGYGKDSNS